MNWDLLLHNQEYVLFLAFIMIIAGISKNNNLFIDVFVFLNNYLKSKRMILFFTSAVTGVLPVPGRVTITAGILDTIAPTDKKKRAKFGIIDYLSTHHYYLWSPIEKSVVIPMAILGFTYLDFMLIIYPLLVTTFVIILGYIFINIKEEDIELNIFTGDVNFKRMLNILPFIFGIGFLAFGFNPAIVFSTVASWYIGFFGVRFKEAISYLNIKLLLVVFGIILFGNYVHLHTEDINNYLKVIPYTMETAAGFLIISTIAFAAAFSLGSSSRFSGIVSILSLTFGIEYFLYFFALEFAAYLLSPVHKCTIIGKMYFGTTFHNYYTVLGTWGLALILVSATIILGK